MMKKHWLMLAGLSMGCIGMNAALAAGDAAAGKLKAETCMGCHGVATYKNVYPTYNVPKLGGQHADYIVSALKAYKSGDRAHQTMHANTSNLNDQDMQDIAAFFAAQGGN